MHKGPSVLIEACALNRLKMACEPSHEKSLFIPIGLDKQHF